MTVGNFTEQVGTNEESNSREIVQEGVVLLGGLGDELLEGGDDNDFLVGFGSDTLNGGLGNDFYVISVTSGGTQVNDIGGELDDLVIFTEDTNFADFADSDSVTFNFSKIELSPPTPGIIGLQKSGTDLVIDLSRDGFIQAEADLTIVNFFDDNGELGTGAIELINIFTDTQSIVDFFAADSEADSLTGSTVYRFFNTQTGAHFYTASKIEKDIVAELDNFNFEGVAYQVADSVAITFESSPVYRFRNEDTGGHFYTISERERAVVAELDNFSFEGEAFLAYEAQVEGSIPVYRFYNSTSGTHFYTPTIAEKEFVETNLLDFQSEGIAYYAFPLTE